jgi:hypothetical protein
VGKEGVFFGCLSILIVFEVGYYLLNPTTLWALGLGAISSIVVVGVSTGLIVGFNFASSGENGFGSRLAFIASTLFCILFRFDIPVHTEGGIHFNPSILSGLLSGLELLLNYLFGSHSTSSIPIGIGLLYPNMSNIFINGLTDPISMFGLIIMSIIVFITVISGLMIAAGEHG